MNCQNCQEWNDNDDLFCRSCGQNLAQNLTQPTVLVNQSNYQPNVPFQNSQMFPTENPSNSNKLWIFGGIGVIACLLFGIGIFFAVTMLKKSTPLPEHFGVFSLSGDNLQELSKKELKNFNKEKDSVVNQDSMPNLSAKPKMIVFSDSGIPLDKLKLVNLDSVKEDGNYQYIDYQIAPIEGKSDMKELRIDAGLPNGKYAFAIFDGFIDEGNHKLWAFQVSNSEINENSAIQTAKLDMKPKPVSVAKPVETFVAPPSPPKDSKNAFCNNRNVMLRSSPSLTANAVGRLQKGQTVYVTDTSSNYDWWEGVNSNWAYVQLPNGKKGWVFHHFVTYR